SLALHGSFDHILIVFVPCGCHFSNLPIYLVFSFFFVVLASRLFVCVQASPLILFLLYSHGARFFCSLFCRDTLLMLHDKLGT
ncbi:hypothetical protein COCMIDRAFT_89723, partial [Bipolaris oryzae ATCC 44560]